MPDVVLNTSSDSNTGTEIQANEKFGQAYIFQARNSATNPVSHDVDGLRGVGIHDGNGVVGWTDAARSDRDKNASTDGTTQNLPFGGPPAGVVGIGYNSDPAIFSDGAGVIGVSRLNTGVFGSSEGGKGVQGQSIDGNAVHGDASGKGDGVSGSSNLGRGVHGSVGGGGDGVFGESAAGTGVHGKSDTNDGVFGESSQGRGVRGKSDTDEGVFGSSDNGTGVAGSSVTGAGVSGFSKESHAVFGENRPTAAQPSSDPLLGPPWIGPTAGCYGVTAENRGVAGVVGGEDLNQSDLTGIDPVAVGVYGAAGHHWRKKGGKVVALDTKGIAGLFWGPVFVAGPFVVLPGNFKSAAVTHPDGSHRLLYCMESPESWFEDFGEARLVKGKAEVKLDRDFAVLVDTGFYHVFLSPYGDSNGLYVSRRTANGFSVREQKGGASTLRFSYRLVAKRKDISAKRLAKINLPPLPSASGMPRPPRRHRRA